MNVSRFFTNSWLSMANFLRLSFSGSKNFLKVVSKNPFKKITKALRKLILSVEFRSIFANFSGFWRKEFFFGKPTYFFFIKHQFLKSLRKFVISVAFCCKIATFGDFKRSKIFSGNTSFLKKTQILHALSNFTIPVGFYGNFSRFNF